MTQDRPQTATPYEPPPPPRFDVDMSSRQNGRQTLRQNGTLEQQQQGTITQDASGNALRTGDLRSSNQAGGAAIDDHSTINRNDKSISMGTQILPECTYGMSIGVPGSAAFQIGVPSAACMTARGQALEKQSAAQVDIVRAQAGAQVELARVQSAERVDIARAQADASITNNAIQIGANQSRSMTQMACDFSIARADTARQSWMQFSDVSGKIGKHPTAKAGAQQLWSEAVTASAQSMEAGAVCVESARKELGLQARKFEVPPLIIETPPKPRVVPKPPVTDTKPCPP
ncbi:MAG: hypothetical protein JSS86_21025, partial [Cyanobacteria bacterium SZAS LIN-2]|nr:hypothetical protein [Cyanobacteria bacterium SZAS LIN-2]